MLQSWEIAALGPLQNAERLYKFCTDNPGGVTQKDLTGCGFNDNEIVQAINLLSDQGRLSISEVNGRPLFRAIDQYTAKKTRGLDKEHLFILQLIQKSLDQGIWTKDLKDESKLPTTIITRVAKELVRRELIKEVKSVKNHKMYIDWDVKPALEVSGGNWYQNGEIDTRRIETLRRQCLRFLTDRKKTCRLQDIHEFLRDQPGQTSISLGQTKEICTSLALDEVILMNENAEGESFFQVQQCDGLFDIFAGRVPRFMNEAHGDLPGLTVPCLSCPLQDECRIGGRISPDKCEYIAAWVRGKTNDACASNDAAYIPSNDW